MKSNRNHMKKILLLNMALGLAGASSLMAGTVDVFITGSTAFRANVYTACQKLFVGGAPTIYYADTAHGGANSRFQFRHGRLGHDRHADRRAHEHFRQHAHHSWLFHRLNSGHTDDGTRHQTRLGAADGTAGNNAHVYTTNAPTIGFSDASGLASPYPATGNFVEENVCVQPFVMVQIGSGLRRGDHHHQHHLGAA